MVGQLDRRFRLRVGVLVVALLCTVTAGVWVAMRGEPRPDGGFLARSGTRLVLGGKPYRYVGQNMPGLAGCGRAASDAELDEAFAELPPRAMVRTWALPRAGLATLERVVAAARRHDILLTVVLADDAVACALATPPASSGRPAPQMKAWYENGFEQSLLPWVRAVADRFRTATAVGMWEVAHVPDSDVTAEDIGKLHDLVGGELKRVDPNHLVASGTGVAGLQGDPDGWRRAHDSAGIDVTTLPDYEMNAGAAGGLAEAISLAGTVNMPLVLAEVGVLASRDGDTASAFDTGRPAETGCVSWTARVDELRAKLDASFATRLAGAAVWSRPADGWPPDPTQCAIVAGGPDDPILSFLAGFQPPAYPVGPGASGSAPADGTGTAPAPVPSTSDGKPVPPTDLAVTRGDGTVTLCWTASAGANAYVIYHRDITVGGDWLRMPIPIEKPCWTGNLFVNAHTYEFQIRGSNATGEGEPSTAVRAAPQGQPPAPPTNLTASPGNGTVTLCWTTSAGADTYVVHHRDVTAAGEWIRMPYPLEKPCWTGNLFVNGHTYEFQVRAGNSNGESEASNVATTMPAG